MFDIPPEGNGEFAGHGDNQDTPDPSGVDGGAGAVPSAEAAGWLMFKPEPGRLDHHTSNRSIAGLGDAVTPFTCPTVVRCRRETDVASHLAPILKRSIVNLPREDACEGRPDTSQRYQAPTLLFACGTRRVYYIAFGFNGFDLLLHESLTYDFTFYFGCDMWR